SSVSTKPGHNTFGNQTQAKDARGAVTTITVDAVGRPVRVDLPAYTRPDTTVLAPFATAVYDPAGRVTSSTDTRGSTTGFRYDSRGRLVGRTDPQVTGQPTP